MTDDLAERKAAAEAAIAAAEETLAARKVKREGDRAVFLLERQAREAQVLIELEDEHGALGECLRVVHVPEDAVVGMVVVKRPAAVLVRRYQDSGKATSEAFEKLVRPSVVYPDKLELGKVLDQYPGTLQRLADAACWLAGFGRSELEGKSES